MTIMNMVGGGGGTTVAGYTEFGTDDIPIFSGATVGLVSPSDYVDVLYNSISQPTVSGHTRIAKDKVVSVSPTAMSIRTYFDDQGNRGYSNSSLTLTGVAAVDTSVGRGYSLGYIDDVRAVIYNNGYVYSVDMKTGECTLLCSTHKYSSYYYTPFTVSWNGEQVFVWRTDGNYELYFAVLTPTDNGFTLGSFTKVTGANFGVVAGKESPLSVLGHIGNRITIGVYKHYDGSRYGKFFTMTYNGSNFDITTTYTCKSSDTYQVYPPIFSPMGSVSYGLGVKMSHVIPGGTGTAYWLWGNTLSDDGYLRIANNSTKTPIKAPFLGSIQYYALSDDGTGYLSVEDKLYYN